MRTLEEEEAYELGYREYYNNGYGSYSARILGNPYTGVDEDNLFDAWEEGYSAAGWDD